MTNDKRKFTGLPAPLGDEIFGMDRPFVASDEERLRNEVQAAIEDEAGAAPMYENIASKARDLGFDNVAEAFSNAARDERKHRNNFKKVLLDIEREIE